MNTKSVSNPLKTALFWLLTLSFPIALFVLAELTLRIIDYREAYQELFIAVPEHEEFLIANPSFSTRYFPSFKPQVAPNTFKKVKEPNTFRVFVLGGSSTQGFPYNYYHSFAANLERSLLAETVDLKIEVVNLGMTAVNSYVLQDLASRILPYEPDAIVIYAGHNEYYGSFGVGTSMFGLGSSIAVKRLIIALKDLRLYQFIETVLRPDSEQTQNRTLMAEAVKESSIEFDAELYHNGIKQFSENLSSTILTFTEQNIPVYVGTLASNLADQAPMSDNAAAIASYEKAKNLLTAGEVDSAFSYFEKAKELDGIRFRAPKKINEVISKNYESAKNVYVVDIYELAKQQSPNGIPGNNWFTDHLHPTAAANQEIGFLFYDRIAETHPTLKEHLHKSVLSLEMPISQFEKTYAEVQISRLLFGYPFIKNLTAEQERARFDSYYKSQLNTSFVDSLAALTWRTQRQVSLSLTDVINFATSSSDSSTVMQHYLPLAYWQLFNKNLLLKGANYALNNRNLDNQSALMLQLAAKNYPNELFISSSLAALYLVNKDLKRAEQWLKKSERIDENDPNTLYNFARLYALKRDSVNARAYFEKYRKQSSN